MVACSTVALWLGRFSDHVLSLVDLTIHVVRVTIKCINLTMRSPKSFECL